VGSATGKRKAVTVKVSIITAVRNAEATVADTLDSVVRQSYPDVEHVIADGLSTDTTLAIARRNVRRGGVVTSQADRGIYDAFNKGFQASSGDVVAYLNADDFYSSPRVIETAVRVIEREDVDAVFADAVFVRPDNPTRVIRRYRSSVFCPGAVRWGIMPAHSTLFLKRRVLHEVGMFDTSYRISADFDFIARAFVKARVTYAYVPQVFTVMRTGGASSSGLVSTTTITREIVRACRQNGIYTNRVMVCARYLWKVFEFIAPGSRRAAAYGAEP
jgi:glycosyltransferase involved in cell wall biosynthesis